MFSGCLRSPTKIMFLTPTQTVRGSAVNSSAEASPASSIGSSWSPSPRRVLWPPLRRYLETPATPSSPEARQPMIMSGRSQPGSPTPSSNLERNQSDEMQRLIGSQFGNQLETMMWTRSLRAYVFRVIGPYGQLDLTMQSLLQWNAYATSSGVSLELVNPDVPGMRLDTQLIVKIHEPNSGMVTRMKDTLSLMNFEEVCYLINSRHRYCPFTQVAG